MSIVFIQDGWRRSLIGGSIDPISPRQLVGHASRRDHADAFLVDVGHPRAHLREQTSPLDRDSDSPMVALFRLMSNLCH